MSNANNGLFIFHRDLRLEDNIGLIKLVKECNNVNVCFIFTPEQVTSKNKYKSENAIFFMINSLKELSAKIEKLGGNLIILYGNYHEKLEEVIDDLNIDIVSFNRDFSPYAKNRTKKTIKLCEDKNIKYIIENDYYLFEPGSIIVSSTGKAYTKYTPFYNKVNSIKLDKPTYIKNYKFKKNTFKNDITLIDAENKFTQINPELAIEFGRENAKKILKQVKNGQFNSYDKNRDFPDKKMTTMMSAYLKFGIVSVRETSESFKKVPSLYRQLVWREFYAHILDCFPEVLGNPLKPDYSNIKWNTNKSLFDKWCKGKTGFPIVDAGMREMNTTGYMHNRSRLIVACFLIKTLLIDWKKGEKYFATKLTDYDPASNNGNWQWVASTGADSQPYFRIFNPWTQSEKFDPECKYIKFWVPELKDVNNKDIHKWYESCLYDEYKDIKYPTPIVDYKEKRNEAIEMYKSALN